MPLSTPAQQALVPALVPLEDLDQAVALNSVTFNLARAVGPALGAVVLVAWGPGVAFAINAASYGALVAGLVAIRPRPVEVSPRGSVWVGFRHLRIDPQLAMMLVGLSALGFGVDPVLTLTPALSEKLTDATFPNAEGLVGLLISAFGAGAVIGTLLIARVRRRRSHAGVAGGGLALLAWGLVILGLAPTAWLAIGGLVVAGIGFLFAVTGITTAMHLRIPERLRGRIMALWGVAFLGSRPVAASLDGAVADLTSPEVATFVAAGIVTACGVAMRLRVAAPPGGGGSG